MISKYVDHPPYQNPSFNPTHGERLLCLKKPAPENQFVFSWRIHSVRGPPFGRASASKWPALFGCASTYVGTLFCSARSPAKLCRKWREATKCKNIFMVMKSNPTSKSQQIENSNYDKFPLTVMLISKRSEPCSVLIELLDFQPLC